MMFLYRIYQILIFCPVVFVWTILTATFTFLACSLGFGRWAGYWPPVLWARIFCWLAFVKVTVEGRHNVSKDKAYIFLANHQGAYDIFAIYGYLGHNFRWMMKASLRKIPFVGFACAASKQVFVDNSSRGGLRHTLEKAKNRLAEGMSLVVFPEGSRTPDGRLHSFKNGAFKLAYEYSLPVVPLTINGAYEVMDRSKMLPRPGHIILTINKPIEPPAEGYDLEQLKAEVKEAIAANLPENRR